jgi:hypothetical protein
LGFSVVVVDVVEIAVVHRLLLLVVSEDTDGEVVLL